MFNTLVVRSQKKKICETCVCTLKDRIEKCYNYIPQTTDEEFLLRIYHNRVKSEKKKEKQHFINEIKETTS